MDFNEALENAMREQPTTILIGEVREAEITELP